MSDSRKPQSPADVEGLRAQVKERYGGLARNVIDAGTTTDCCGSGGGIPADNPVTTNLYDADAAGAVPAAAIAASLGCGNPTALVEMREGQVVLDLGSGGGIDVLLSARRVGPSGKAYGLDMTDEMLELARINQRESGLDNVEFLKGSIESVPLPDASVDIIISNCVINLSVDKPTVFREAFRVLRPGGRFAVSDIVITGEVDEKILRSVEAWLGCVAGALKDHEFQAGLESAGFTEVEIVPTRVYTADDARQFLDGDVMDEAAVIAADGHVMSAFVRATKPQP